MKKTHNPTSKATKSKNSSFYINCTCCKQEFSRTPLTDLIKALPSAKLIKDVRSGSGTFVVSPTTQIDFRIIKGLSFNDGFGVFSLSVTGMECIQAVVCWDNKIRRTAWSEFASRSHHTYSQIPGTPWAGFALVQESIRLDLSIDLREVAIAVAATMIEIGVSTPIVFPKQAVDPE